MTEIHKQDQEFALVMNDNYTSADFSIGTSSLIGVSTGFCSSSCNTITQKRKVNLQNRSFTKDANVDTIAR